MTLITIFIFQYNLSKIHKTFEVIESFVTKNLEKCEVMKAEFFVAYNLAILTCFNFENIADTVDQFVSIFELDRDDAEQEFSSFLTLLVGVDSKAVELIASVAANQYVKNDDSRQDTMMQVIFFINFF